MSLPHFQVIVIGGGPAGTSAAKTLSKSGINVCIIDKHVFPRDKLCGGLLTLRSKKVFEEIFDGSWDDVVEKTTRGVKFFHKSKLLNWLSDYKDISFTRRCHFDYYLLKNAEASGTHLLLGKTVRELSIKENSLKLGDGNILSYDYLIGADGVNSMVAKTLFGSSFDKDKVAFALEIEIDDPQAILNVSDPEIYFGFAHWGYGWIFPKTGSLTVGLGGLLKYNQNIKEEFKDFLVQCFGYLPKAKIKGHHLPFGNYKKYPGRGNILLCGDAAGLVEPITGEGIAFAMQSGHFAAQSIITVLNINSDKTVFEIYNEKYKSISNILDYANLLRYLLFPRWAEIVFVSILPKSKSIPMRFMDLMAGEMEYKDYIFFIFNKTYKFLLKKNKKHILMKIITFYRY